MTIFEHRTIGLLEEIRDLLAKLTSEPPQNHPKNSARNGSPNRPRNAGILRNNPGTRG